MSAPIWFKRAYCGADTKSQLAFLIRLIHNLTIVTRALRTDERSETEHLDILIAISELQHKITGQMIRHFKDDPERYPDDVFCDIVCAYSMPDVLERHVAWAIRESLKYAGLARDLGEGER